MGAIDALWLQAGYKYLSSTPFVYIYTYIYIWILEAVDLYIICTNKEVVAF